jgi:hypothetical protein
MSDRLLGRPTKATVVSLLFLAVVPPAIATAGEILKNRLVWLIRATDFLDLVVLAPFYFAMLFSVHRIVFSGRDRSASSTLSLALICLLLYGHAMHLTANAVYTYSTEIQNYRSVLPADTYDLLYFLDEVLGHLLFFGAIFGLLGLWTWVELDHPIGRLSPRLVALDIVAGIVEGVALGIVLIEATQPWLGYVAGMALSAMIGVGAARAVKQGALPVLGERPIWVFVLSTAAAMLASETIYWAVFGFIELSDLT